MQHSNDTDPLAKSGNNEEILLQKNEEEKKDPLLGQSGKWRPRPLQNHNLDDSAFTGESQSVKKD